MDSKILTYGLIGFVLLALIFGLGYWFGFKSGKPIVNHTTANFEGKPDTTINVITHSGVALVYVDTTTDKPKIKIDTTIVADDAIIKLHSDDIVARGIEVAHKVLERFVYVTKTDTLTKTITVELPRPFYDTFEFGVVVGTTATAILAWIITSIITGNQ